jgi:NAD(P)-dependent dehydrogenase (short-subunit alcohol dehydrogenase family)
MQNVLITGANSGIGRAAAVRFAQAGHHVFAAMRDLAKSGKLLALASAAGVQDNIEPVKLDVTDEESVKNCFLRIAPIDVLVNNAGIAWNAAVEDVEIDSAKQVFETNYWGVLRCIQAVLPRMRERRAGTIVNVSSVMGRVAGIGQPIYASSKWALECLSENLAQEMAPHNVRVIVIEPGVTRTAILAKNADYPSPTHYESAYRRMMQFHEKGALANATSESVADTIVFSLEDPKRLLRYPCAWAGTEMTEGRAQISDEDWVQLGAETDDNAYYDAFEKLFGLDLRTDG